MGQRNNLIKFNRDIKINAATCVIAAILLYVIISVVSALNKDPITIYKVSKSNVSNNITLNGLIIRDEEVIKAGKSGYVCYYIRDGAKVKKSSTVCTIDETGQVYDVINDSDGYEGILTTDDYNDVRALISLYKVSYNDVEFYSSYNFENNINNKVLELTNEIIMQQMSDTGKGGASLSAITSPDSGLVTYYIDGYENFDISKISHAYFDQSKYVKQTLKTGDIVSADSAIVKIIPSESWNIVAPISTDQIEAISQKSKISFYINNSSYIISMPFEIIDAQDGSYINISLNKYLANFLSERFVSVEIIMDDDTGLKVPVSAIVNKTVYKIPINYLSAGGNQNSSNRINIQIRDEKNDITIKQISPTIYKTDEKYCYVDPLAFEDTDVIIDINSNKNTAVSLLESEEITGVYVANRGTAEFRMINVLKVVDEFALVENEGELSAYDNIVLDASKVSENQIIY